MRSSEVCSGAHKILINGIKRLFRVFLRVDAAFTKSVNNRDGTEFDLHGGQAAYMAGKTVEAAPNAVRNKWK